jgi:transcriptional regulator with XRE-family HTH domain
VQLSVDKVPAAVGGNATVIYGIMALSKKGVLIVNIADRIQSLRKTQGLSQEELAEKVGVSRQAVSKWESEQSVPDLDKVIIMSEYFDVTTDYILKGIEPVKDLESNSNAVIGKILFIASTTFIAIGLFCAFAGWYEEQTADSIWGSMIIQAVGVAGYFIGKLISLEKPHYIISWLNIALACFMPISLIVNYSLSKVISPYPIDTLSACIFLLLYVIITASFYVILKKKNK